MEFKHGGKNRKRQGKKKKHGMKERHTKIKERQKNKNCLLVTGSSQRELSKHRVVFNSFTRFVLFAVKR